MPVQIAAAAINVASKISGGLIHGSSTSASNAATDVAYNGAAGGDQSSLDSLVAKAGYNGGVGMAVGAGAKDYAQGKLWSLVSSGAVIQPSDAKTNRQAGYTNTPYLDLPYDTPRLVGKFLVANPNKANASPDSRGKNLSNPLAGDNMPAWVLIALAALLGWGAYKVVKG